MNTTAEVLALLTGQRVTLRTSRGVLMDFVVSDAKEVTIDNGDKTSSKRIAIAATSVSAPRLARD